MKLTDSAKWLTILTFTAFLSYMVCTRPKHKCPEVVGSTTDTFYTPKDSFPYTVYLKGKTNPPTPVAEVPPPDTIYLPFTSADTAAIVADYFVTRHYLDSTTDDTSYKLILSHSVTENKLSGIEIRHQNLRPTAIVTNTTVVEDPDRWQAFGGILFTTGSDAMIAPYLQIRHKRFQPMIGYTTTGKIITGLSYQLK